ncbi:hypothetical protein VTJ04DRAFT_3032 [Mycothermus thermophilus]|uniref:uncharacterized protein n=1 Tax=Humicola insolens TaxID=85995 RepID=UPI003742EEDC
MTVTVTAVTLNGKDQERETQGGCSWFGCISTAPSYSVCRHIDPGQEEDSIGGEQLLLLARSQSEDDDEPKKTSSGNSSHEDHTTTTPTKPSATDTTLTTSVRETSEPSSSSSSHSHTSPPPPPAPPTSSSTTATSTAHEPFPTDSPTSGATIAPPPATTIPASPSPSDTQPPASHGVTLSISALVGIVVSCAAVFLFAALSAYMWWRRYRRDKKEKEKAGDKGGGGGGGGRGGGLWSGFSRGSGSQRHQQHQQQQLGNQQPLVDEDQFPLGMDSVFNPMAQNGPGSVFDRAQGCMGSVNSMLGRNSISSDSPTQLGSHTGVGTSKMSPEIPPTSPVELDSVPVGRGTAAPARPEKRAKPETRGSWWGEENSVLRATLNATEQERKAGMYANSWSKFQGVQL